VLDKVLLVSSDDQVVDQAVVLKIQLPLFPLSGCVIVPPVVLPVHEQCFYWDDFFFRSIEKLVRDVAMVVFGDCGLESLEVKALWLCRLYCGFSFHDLDRLSLIHVIYFFNRFSVVHDLNLAGDLFRLYFCLTALGLNLWFWNFLFQTSDKCDQFRTKREVIRVRWF